MPYLKQSIFNLVKDLSITNQKIMLRKFTIILMSLVLCWTTIACSSPDTSQSSPSNVNKNVYTASNFSSGKYPVQQATYNDVDGSYSLMLLNTPPGSPPVFTTSNLQMARLTDEEVAEGNKTYLNVDGDQATMHLTEDFKIEYVHNVTETQTNPQTGSTETVIVRRESSFWTPFAGAIAGQLVGNLLFSPRYYVPPVYQPGAPLTGYGGYGNTYSQAVDRYQERYQAPPAAVKNSQTFRTTGNLRRSSGNATGGKNAPNATRSTGSGFGSSTLNRSNSSNTTKKRSNSGFGSSRKRSGFGSNRRSFSPGRRR